MIPYVAEPKPMVELNTTPLIDVMLVLLVMFIITIPIQTHAVKLDIPAPGPSARMPNPLSNRLEIEADGALHWNGQPISRHALRGQLALARQMQPEPELQLKPDPAAPYGTVDDVLALIKREHVRRFGFVGNEAYALR